MLLFVVAFIVLQNSAIQNRIFRSVASSLSEQLGTEVQIGNAYYRFFNTFTAENLYVEDQQKDTLAYIEKADLHFRFFSLFTNQIEVKSVDLHGFYGNLKSDSTGTNLDFIIKAFKKPKKEPFSSTISFDIQKVRLHKSGFSFTNLKKSPISKNGVFNANAMKYRDINAELDFHFFSKDSMELVIDKFNAIEQSGLTVKDIVAKAYMTDKGIYLSSMKIKLPASEINIADASLKYDSLQAMRNFNNEVRIKIPLKESSLAWADFAAFNPGFEYVKGNILLSGDLSGKVSSLRFQNINFRYGNNMTLIANLDLNGLPNIDETFVYGDIAKFNVTVRELQDFIANLSRKPVTLPAQLRNINYSGNITGFFSNLVAYGNLNTSIGSVSTDIQLQFSNNLRDIAYSGKLKSRKVELGKLLNNKAFGNIAFDISTKGQSRQKSGLKGEINANVFEFNFNEYAYKDIAFKGNYDGNGFDGIVTVQDENIKADFAGIIDLTETLPIFNFALNVEELDLKALNLYTKYSNSNLSFKASTNMVGNSLDNLNGYIRMDSIEFTNNGMLLNIDSIYAQSSVIDGNTGISIISDFINGSVKGHFLYSTIGQTIDKIIQTYLPAVSFSKRKTFDAEPNQMKINLSIENLSDLTKILESPLVIEGKSVISGEIDESKNLLDLSIDVPTIRINKQSIENFRLNIDNNQNELHLTTRAQYLNTSNTLVNFFATANAANDKLLARAGWQNTQMITNAGEVILNTQFAKENGKTTAFLNIEPAQVIISDSIWNIHRGSIYWGTDSTLTVNDIRFEGDNQHIYIDGKASQRTTDSLNVELGNLNINFILRLVGLNGFDFGGRATGKATLFSAFKRPIYIADIDVENVTMNDMRVGDAQLYSTWDAEKEHVVLSGIFTEGQDTVVIADGAYIPKADSINILFDAHGLGLSFLRRYFDGVVDNVTGFGTGKVRLLGKIKEIGFDGDVFVRDGQATVTMLNTTYTFNDYVYLRPKSLSVRNFKLYDTDRNLATANGYMNHSGLFQKMVYDFNIQAKNLMALNTKSGDNEYFFGKAHVDGNVRIHGNDFVTNMDVNAISKPHSKLYIRMASTYTASDNSFIRFIDKNAKPISEVSTTRTKSSHTFNLNLQVEATPDAEVELIIDPRAGDMINARGSGNLRLEFNTNSDLRLFGTYTIQSGYYLFTLQNVMKKEFKLDQGSSISWSGDLTNANVNIRGIYSLTASLRDLLDSQSAITRSNVPVNCVLKLTDNLMRPTIEFGIELPSSDESVRQYVRNVINTEEMMNKQILSLLLLNRFYKPEYLNTAENEQGGSEALSFATATLNGWLSRMSQNNQFSFGLDMRMDDQTAQYQAAILYQPNERLIINGNLGYQTDDLYDAGNRFIGDFDLEYKLIESGKLRFKAYNRTVDRLGVAKLSQGAGLVYREEFESVGELINYYWHIFSDIWKRKENNETTTE